MQSQQQQPVVKVLPPAVLLPRIFFSVAFCVCARPNPTATALTALEEVA